MRNCSCAMEARLLGCRQSESYPALASLEWRTPAFEFRQRRLMKTQLILSFAKSR